MKENIFALASKKRSNRKIGHFIPLIGEFYFDSLAPLFCLNLFLEAKSRNPGKQIVGFLEDLTTPKGHSKIN